MENTNPWLIEGSSKARLVAVTPNAEETMAYVARVTSKKQENPNFEGLLRYCIEHGHWSVMEQAYMTIEVITPLAIAVQLLRHRSFTMQQFSGRYEDQSLMAVHTGGLSTFMDMFYVPEQARLQDTKNRQNSIPTADTTLTGFMKGELETAYKACCLAYKNMLDNGISKELARFALPQGVYTRLYVTGSCRSWIHYLSVRDDEGVAQYEHCELARSAKKVFAEVFPTVHRTLESSKEPEKTKTNTSFIKTLLSNLLASLKVFR